MDDEKYLTEEQKAWLTSRGGKTFKDVNRDRDGLFVLMSSPLDFAGKEKVYLPGFPKHTPSL